MNATEAKALAEVQSAMRGEVRLTISPTFTHGDAVRVECRVGGRWKRMGPLLFPPDDGTIADVLVMLAAFRRGT